MNIKTTVTLQPNSTDVSHLQWLQGFLNYHIDLEDRKVTVISGSGWQFSFKDEENIEMEPGVEIFIPGGKFHKITKGTTDLVVDIEIILESEPDVVEESNEPLQEQAPIPNNVSSDSIEPDTDSD